MTKLEVVEKFPATRALRRREASLREEETVLSLTGGMFSDDLAEDLFLRTLFLLEGWRTIVARDVWCGWLGKGRSGWLLGLKGGLDGPYI